MMYKLPLGLLMIIGSYCIQSQDMINQKMDVVDDDQSLSLNDILLQRSEEKDEFTAGSTRCKKGDKCKPGFLGSYTCETDYGWGYCCTGDCVPYKDEMRCPSGINYARCGYAGNRTAKGTPCLPSHHCGIHEEFYLSHPDYYWCYTTSSKKWGFCCRPGSKCTYTSWWYGNQCNYAYSSYSHKYSKCRV